MKRTSLILLLATVSLSGSVILQAQTIASSSGRQKSRILKRLKASEGVQIYADNSKGSPLYVQEATVKEILGDDFTILTGEAHKHFKQATFPDVTLSNGSAKTIKSFAIAVKSAADKPRSWYGLLKNNVSIPPSSTYKLTSGEWPMAERVSVEQARRFVSVLRKPGLDSAKAWIPGSASDLKVTIGWVEFDDGTTWMVSSDSDW